MNTQMSTPINSLPIKTVVQQQQDMDDPLIQNVLKEFEDDMMHHGNNTQQASNQANMQNNAHTQAPRPNMYTAQQMQQPAVQQPVHDTKRKHHTISSFVDLEVIKKAAIITIIVVLFQISNLVPMLLSKLPESITKYVSGKEIIINTILLFIIFYIIIYMNII